MTYELIIQHNGTVMFPAVVEDVTIEWERQGQPGKLSFERSEERRVGKEC